MPSSTANLSTCIARTPRIARYRADCACRKPKPGLIYQAARNMDIDVAESWFIGDNVTDMLAGRNAGCRTCSSPGCIANFAT